MVVGLAIAAHQLETELALEETLTCSSWLYSHHAVSHVVGQDSCHIHPLVELAQP